ncbi:MAG: amidase [Acidimicrobiia bacterium]
MSAASASAGSTAGGDEELCDRPAVELAGLLASGALGARELLAAHQHRLDRLDGDVNAVVTRTPERAEQMAAAADEHLARTGTPLGPLHGLPVAHKDLALTAGVRTTFGSPIFGDFVPDVDDLVVQRLHSAGAVMVGKTNTPEFGAGSQTFNAVFGATRNPYDLDRTCGGSSGGAAVALRCGLVAVADGSDMGGSLRNPANFCNVVGLRPSPGRVPSHPARYLWGTLGVQGPMGRTVADVALQLSVMAGWDARVPLSAGDRLPGPGTSLRPASLRNLRIAVSPRFGDLPVDPQVAAAVLAVADVAEEAGARVDAVDPGWAGADEAFETLRAFQFEMGFGSLYDRHAELMKDTVRWNIEAGRALSGPDVARAEVRRGEVFSRFAAFFERFDLLLLPVSQVLPFPLTQEWVAEIDGVAMGSYIEWMRSCSRVTVTGCPALSLPAAFSTEGLPIGVQLVTAYRSEWRLLELAAAFEELLGAGLRRPPLVEALA